jgi:type IV pilus assembly protein PilM
LNWANHEEELKNTKGASFEQKLNSALKQVLEKMELKSGGAYVSIPGFSGLITIIDLPEMQDEQLAKAIQFEAHKYIPSSLDEVAMSWEIIEHTGAKPEEKEMPAKNAQNRRIKVLLVAAPKRDIERYDRLVSGTKIEVKAIELETFSIARSLIGDDLGTFFIVDIGSRSTNIVLVEKGIVRVNRNIDAGGDEITSAIAESLSVSRARAEIFKMGDKDFLNGTESSLIIPMLELVVGESRRILGAYKEKNPEMKIDKILLSGGTSKMKGLQEYFSRSLGAPVSIGSPWNKVSLDSEKEKLTENLGASFSVAIGLALRGVEEYKRE